jgi:hypothetical protein
MDSVKKDKSEFCFLFVPCLVDERDRDPSLSTVHGLIRRASFDHDVYEAFVVVYGFHNLSSSRSFHLASGAFMSPFKTDLRSFSLIKSHKNPALSDLNDDIVVVILLPAYDCFLKENLIRILIARIMGFELKKSFQPQPRPVPAS